MHQLIMPLHELPNNKFYCAGHTNEIQKSKINLKNILTLQKILFITNALAYHASA
jgi:hypothetical protein